MNNILTYKMDKNTTYSFTTIGSGNFIIQVEKSDGTFKKKNIKVEFDNTFTFKALKTKIKAYNAAAGLYKYFEYCINNNIMLDYIDHLIVYMMDFMKEYRGV